mmetsp:Transcript_54786/g.116977  ORF Transcript_54786/g.116977 Transcript_54786/m.116977 type:complete len:164 (+) Transcript_54786:682-1173(+)
MLTLYISWQMASVSSPSISASFTPEGSLGWSTYDQLRQTIRRFDFRTRAAPRRSASPHSWGALAWNRIANSPWDVESPSTGGKATLRRHHTRHGLQFDLVPNPFMVKGRWHDLDVGEHICSEEASSLSSTGRIASEPGADIPNQGSQEEEEEKQQKQKRKQKE